MRFFHHSLSFIPFLMVMFSAFVISLVAAQMCRSITCPRGYQVVKCNNEGEQYRCERCPNGTYLKVTSTSQDPIQCSKPYCPPEGRLVFLNATREPWFPPVCQCDTTQRYFGKYENCEKLKESCPGSMVLNHLVGCVCPDGQVKEDGICIMQTTTVSMQTTSGILSTSSADSTVDHHDQSESPNTTVIAVGCVGAGVVIALIGFVFWRQKARSKSRPPSRQDSARRSICHDLERQDGGMALSWWERFCCTSESVTDGSYGSVSSDDLPPACDNKQVIINKGNIIYQIGDGNVVNVNQKAQVQDDE